MSSGPFLYDDDPAPLHTGTPRSRNGLLLAIGGAVVLVAVLMAVLLPVITGSADEQAEEVAGVFVAALSQGDTETAYQLLCDDERARLQPEDLAGAYLQEGTPEVTGSRAGAGDELTRLVDVRWGAGASATTTEVVVVPEGGTKVCGTR
jgi:type II secretory pathway pseudopilin PulG